MPPSFPPLIQSASLIWSRNPHAMSTIVLSVLTPTLLGIALSIQQLMSHMC